MSTHRLHISSNSHADKHRRFETGNDMVTIILEDEPNTNFTVSKTLLCNASKTSQKELAGEDGQHVFKIQSGHDRATFELFLYWLYGRNLETEFWKTRAERKSAVEGSAKELVRLWGFADMHKLPSQQNLAMRLYLVYLKSALVDRETLQSAIDTTHIDSMIVKAVLYRMVFDCRTNYDEDEELAGVGDIPGVLARVLKAAGTVQFAVPGGRFTSLTSSMRKTSW